MAANPFNICEGLRLMIPENLTNVEVRTNGNNLSSQGLRREVDTIHKFLQSEQVTYQC